MAEASFQSPLQSVSKSGMIDLSRATTSPVLPPLMVISNCPGAPRLLVVVPFHVPISAFGTVSLVPPGVAEGVGAGLPVEGLTEADGRIADRRPLPLLAMPGQQVQPVEAARQRRQHGDHRDDHRAADAAPAAAAASGFLRGSRRARAARPGVGVAQRGVRGPGEPGEPPLSGGP